MHDAGDRVAKWRFFHLHERVYIAYAWINAAIIAVPLTKSRYRIARGRDICIRTRKRKLSISAIKVYQSQRSGADYGRLCGGINLGGYNRGAVIAKQQCMRVWKNFYIRASQFPSIYIRIIICWIYDRAKKKYYLSQMIIFSFTFSIYI